MSNIDALILSHLKAKGLSAVAKTYEDELKRKQDAAVSIDVDADVAKSSSSSSETELERMFNN
jgi:hypothetical protein